MSAPSSAQAHVANIGERGQRRRRRTGAFWLLVGIALASWLLMNDESSGWYLLLVVPFTLAALGLLQAREKT